MWHMRYDTIPSLPPEPQKAGPTFGRPQVRRAHTYERVLKGTPGKWEVLKGVGKIDCFARKLFPRAVPHPCPQASTNLINPHWEDCLITRFCNIDEGFRKIVNGTKFLDLRPVCHRRGLLYAKAACQNSAFWKLIQRKGVSHPTSRAFFDLSWTQKFLYTCHLVFPCGQSSR